ncbi:MAG: preprotein translocase subunit SecG [Clostridia bacterium]|nr:preprotein translocase subunit SecG [Clostridia bacterium]MBQ6960460.1 preprotein translocase subunit SecG [Clostridia bacterium]MBR0217802.1 preprotein translocase subunit SecG [Clostridia bacterium]
MSAVEVILNILMVISALVMIVTVLMQSSDSDGMGALTGGSETFFGKNKNNTLEGKLSNATKISAIVFVLLAIVMLIVA